MLTLLDRSLSTCSSLSPVQSCTHRRPPTDNEKTMPRCMVQILNYKNDAGLEKSSRTTIFEQTFPRCISDFYDPVIKNTMAKINFRKKVSFDLRFQSPQWCREAWDTAGMGSWLVTFSSGHFLQQGCASQMFRNLLKSRHQLGTEH